MLNPTMRTFHLLSLVLLSVPLRLLAAEDPFLTAVRQDTESLSSAPSRMTGTPGHARASEWLRDELKALNGVQVWTHEFPVWMPTVERSTVSIDSGPGAGTHAVYPLWPDLVRLNTTGPDGIQGRIVYVGDGSMANIPARSLEGNIAAMEMSAYRNWKNPFAMNASAVLLLGSPDDQQQAPAAQALYHPRYYLPDGDLADAIRNGASTEATVHCDMSWERVTARNLYAVVPSAGDGAEGPAIGLAAATDAMSMVMDQAPGADNAVDTAFLLNLARETAANPPRRPVLFAFVDANAVNQLGMRQFLTMLSVTESNPTRKDYLETDRDQLEDYQEQVEKIQRIGSGREALEQIHNKREYRDLQRAFKDVLSPELLGIKEESADLRLDIYAAEKQVAEGRKTREEANADIARLTPVLEKNQARTSFLNRMLVQVLTDEPVTDDILPEATRALKRAGERILDQAAAQRERIEVFAPTDKIRNDILQAMNKEPGQPPVEFVVGVDLSDGGFTVGPGLYGAHLRQNATQSAREFTTWLKQKLQDPASSLLTGQTGRLLETTLNHSAVRGTEDPTGFNVGNTPLLTSPAASFKIPAVTWKTLSGHRHKVDTPQDRADRLDWDRLAPQVLTSRAVLAHMLSDETFTPENISFTRGSPEWRRPWGSVVRESVAETVPRTPMPGFLVTLVPRAALNGTLVNAPGIRRYEIAVTREDGGFTFFPMAGGFNSQHRLNVNEVYAFNLDERGRITHGRADNTSAIQGTLASGFDLNAGPGASPARLLAFEAHELNGPEFFDPRFLEPLSSYTLIDPITGGRPKRGQFTVNEGQMWGLLMPGTRWQLILRAGTAKNRMILMNLDPELSTNLEMKPREAMRTGFSMQEPLPSTPAHVSARDFQNIDSWRLKTFQQAGISSDILHEMHAGTTDLLAEADAAIAADDGGRAQRFAIQALANELRVYEALLATGMDVTRGAIFLMILIVPFAVAMERLLFACVKIVNRISVSFAIFALMSLILWSFHPAFRITNQPLIILMAFAVLLLSLFVIHLIFTKFEADLEEMRSGQAERGGAQTSRGGVIGSAVWLGIANMRKRKLRTFLTAITIVLITFALLCFSSSTTYQNKRDFTVSDTPPPYAGLLVKQAAMSPFHPRALPNVTALAGEHDVVPRYWWTSTQPTWNLHVRNPASGRQVSLKAALGLSPQESLLTAPQEIMDGWDRFAQGGACFLSQARAREMNLVPGDRVGVGGRELILAGTFDPSTIEAGLTMLDGQSLLPFDFSIESDSDGGVIETSEPMDAAALEADLDKTRVAPDSLIILPADLVRDLGGDLRSMGIPTRSHANTADLVASLSNVLAFPLYYGTANGTNVIAATPLIPKVPRNLVTPLILAALIIFNTMLNSVAERKKEIHIYTSLGLAPVHVGILFLSEAVTYGLMGSVFGYVAGQGLAAILTGFDLMGGITLNYSGSSVIMTMSLVIGVVVISSLVPAIMAGKLASPSDDMKWTVPDPVDGVIRDQLPFTIHREAAPGLTAFVHDYMVAHEEGTIGHFASADNTLIAPEGDTVAGLKGTVWLAPYDLGVRQEFCIRILPDEEGEEVCRIVIELTHAAGQMNTWWKQNRTFLGDLRKQLLGWRKVTPERILEYIDEFDAKLKHAST